jgi:hypothetical protein
MTTGVSGPAPGPPRVRLLEQVAAALRVRHYSPRTVDAYCAWVRRFVLASGRRHPRELEPDAVRRFLTALAVEGSVGASTQNQALAALTFLYRDVLGTPLGAVEGVARAKRPVRVPTVLTRGEVRAVPAALDGTPKLVALLLYGAWLRLMEALRLRLKDLDLERGELVVRGRKGDEDRVTVLPAVAGEPLRAHLARVRAQHRRDRARARAGRAPGRARAEGLDRARRWRLPGPGELTAHDLHAPAKVDAAGDAQAAKPHHTIAAIELEHELDRITASGPVHNLERRRRLAQRRIGRPLSRFPGDSAAGDHEIEDPWIGDTFDRHIPATAGRRLPRARIGGRGCIGLLSNRGASQRHGRQGQNQSRHSDLRKSVPPQAAAPAHWRVSTISPSMRLSEIDVPPARLLSK